MGENRDVGEPPLAATDGGKSILPTDNRSFRPLSTGIAPQNGHGHAVIGRLPLPGETSASADYAETIDDVVLPDRVAALADDYAAVFGERDRFLWQWIYSLLPEFTLSSVADEHAEEVRVQKTIFTLFITLLDDLAEKRGDVRTFEEIQRSVCWADGAGGAQGGAGRVDDDGADRPGVDREV